MKESKFKVGDKVVILEPRYKYGYPFGWNERMDEFVNTTKTVVRVEPLAYWDLPNQNYEQVKDDPYKYKLSGPGNDWTWASTNLLNAEVNSLF